MDPVIGGQLVSGDSYTDTEVENGTTYDYRITALDNSDTESEASAELEITPFSNPPDHPDSRYAQHLVLDAILVALPRMVVSKANKLIDSSY